MKNVSKCILGPDERYNCTVFDVKIIDLAVQLNDNA